MRIQICAVARLRRGPEKDLFDDYLSRFEKSGRVNSLGPARLTEVEDRKGGRAEVECDLLRRAIPQDNEICILDERGKVQSSPEFAKWLETQRDRGTRELTFVIGGADGLTPEFRTDANHALSFGQMVWPHALARVMLAEQLYRAATILNGSPYHRI